MLEASEGLAIVARFLATCKRLLRLTLHGKAESRSRELEDRSCIVLNVSLQTKGFVQLIQLLFHQDNLSLLARVSGSLFPI